MAPEQTARTRRAWGSLDREQIAAAALTVVREEGIDALTIRRVAAELDASRMALYRHVESKDALIDLAAGAIAEPDLPALTKRGGDWEEQLRRIARTLRERLRTYPGLAALLLSRANASPAGLALADHCLAILRDAGFDTHQAARAYAAFFDVVLGRIHRELTTADGAPERRLAAQVEAARRTGGADLARLREALPVFETLTADEIFETELEMLIAGLRTIVSSGA